MHHPLHLLLFFFFNDTATTEIYTLSLHDALPISHGPAHQPGHRRVLPGITAQGGGVRRRTGCDVTDCGHSRSTRSEEHTSELQSRPHLVCRLLLEKKKNQTPRTHP